MNTDFNFSNYESFVKKSSAENIKNNKLIQEKKQNPDKELFLKRYYEILKNQFEISNEIDLLPTMIKHIEKCPFCRANKFILTHDYSLKSCQSINIFFKCLKCDEILYSQNLRPFTFDISFEFNENIKTFMDRYVEEYPNNREEILFKINKEFENTKAISLLEKEYFLSNDIF